MAIELTSAYVSLVPTVKGMRRAIDTELDGAGRQAEKAGDDAGDGFTSGFGGKLAAFGAAAGLALGAALVKGTFDAVGREAENDLLAARLNLSPEESERIGAVAGSLYANAYGESLGEVNEAIRAIGDVFALDGLESDVLEEMGAQALDVAKILGEDVGRAVRASGQLMRTGLAGDAEEGFDLVLTAARRLPQEMSGELIDTIEEYGSSFAELGLTGEQALASVTNAVTAGARNVDVAADAFKEFSIRAIDGSTLTSEAYQQLGLDAEEMAQRIANGGAPAAAATSEIIQAISGIGDQVLQEEIGVALFGTKFEDLGADVVAAMDPASASLGDFSGAASRAGDTLNDNLSTRLETLKRKGLQGLADFAERFAVPALEAFVVLVGDISAAFSEEGLAGVLGVVQERLEPVISFVRDNAPLFAGFGAAILAVLVPAFVAWAISAGSAAIATIAAAAPVILVAAAIGLLAAGLVWAYQNSELFRGVIDAIGRFLRDKVLPAVKTVAGWLLEFGKIIFRVAGWIIEKVTPAVKAFATEIVEMGKRAYEMATDVIGFFGDIVDFINGLQQTIRDAASGMWDGIKEPFVRIMDAIRNLWNDTVGGFSVSIPDWVPTFGGRGFTIPKLHDGGIVPGKPGTEHLYVLEAGERVTSASDVRAGREDYTTPAGDQGPGVNIEQVNVINRPWLEELTEAVNFYPAAA